MSSSIRFDFKKHGFDTPCRLTYGDKHDEIVRFEKGLSKSASFSEIFKMIEKDLETFGISIPDDALAEKFLSKKIHHIVFFHDEDFGAAFLLYYYPKMSKRDPSNFHWEII